jgi:hypothetical protein
VDAVATPASFTLRWLYATDGERFRISTLAVRPVVAPAEIEAAAARSKPPRDGCG